MQLEHIKSSNNLRNALLWLSKNGIDTVAWKCIDNAVTIQIEPTEHAHESIIYGCTIVKAPANQLLER